MFGKRLFFLAAAFAAVLILSASLLAGCQAQRPDRAENQRPQTEVIADEGPTVE